MKQRVPRLVRNIMSNWTGTVASILIAFFLSPFVVHHLGASAYGVWLLITSITGYLGLLDFGGRTVTCYIAKFHTQGKHEEASRMVSTALLVFTLLGGAAAGASIAAAMAPTRLFHVPKSLQSSLRVVLILAGASVASALVSNIFGAIVVGLQRFEVANATQVCVGIIRALVTVLVLEHGKGLIALAIINLISSVATGFIYAWASWRVYPQLTIRYKLSDRLNAYLIFSFGSHLFLLNASTYLIFYTDSIVIGAFLPVAMITFFAIAGNLVMYSRTLINGVATTLIPLASSLEAEGDRRRIEQIGLDGPRYATMLVLPIVVTFIVRGKTFIGLWMGADYAGPSSRCLHVLSVALFFSAANQVAMAIMVGLNKHRTVVHVSIAEGMLNLALSIALVHSIGIVGVAWGTAIPIAITGLVFWPTYIRRRFGIKPVKYVLSTWLRPAVAAVPFAIISLAVDRLWYAPTMWFFFFQIGLTLPFAIIASWFGCFSRAERCYYLEQIISRTARVEGLA